MITGLGTGIGKDDFDASRLRYHKIIIMTDAAVDGSHIRTLLLTFFVGIMRGLIGGGVVCDAEPPLYRIKKGKSEKYIKDEKEFKREIMRRATENLKLEIGSNGDGAKATIEGGELRAFLMSLDEYEQIFHKVERRLRDPRVVTAISNPDLRLDSKADFSDRKNLQQLYDVLAAAQIKPELKADEEHSAWMVSFHDATNAERRINVELAAQPDYKKLRVLAKQTARFNIAPFVVVKNDRRESQPNWLDLLNHVKSEGKRDSSVQRYKGLGEMNAEQLADTTMNPEKRTLLQLPLEHPVESKHIFSTLMAHD